MDKAGRRPLLLYPMVGMIFVLGLITLAFNMQVSSLKRTEKGEFFRNHNKLWSDIEKGAIEN